jgi:hypothetical protein
MNILFKFLGVIITFVMLQPVAQAVDVEVTWTNPDKYQDIRPGNESRKHFRERTFNNFEKHFAEMAAKLPENQKLVIDVTDVNLAGDVRFDTIEQIRVVRDIYFPRMKFSYQLLNADNSVVVAKDVDIKDMSFMTGSNIRYKNKALGYEKKMLDDWFKKEFSDYITK